MNQVLIYLITLSIPYTAIFAMRHNPYHSKKFNQLVARVKKENAQRATTTLTALLNTEKIWRTPLAPLVKAEITRLINEGANPDCSDKIGDTALAFACKFGLIDLAQILLQNGANPNLVNTQGQNALMVALRMGTGICENIFKLLVERNIDINQCDSFGSNPLRYAIQSGYPHAADLLINAGADLEVIVNGKNAYELSVAITKECMAGNIRPERKQAHFFSTIGSKEKIK